MGIDISENKHILFNGGHQRRVNTSVHRNPTIKVVSGLKIYSIFRRSHVRDDKFDGNPFIYALKSKHGYKIDRTNLALIRPHFRAILCKSIREFDVDLVIPVPSEHRIASYLAYRASAASAKKWAIASILAKRTVGEMLMEYEGNILPKKKRLIQRYQSQLRAWKRLPAGSTVSMKDVENSIREYFNPLRLDTDEVDVQGKRILLVDDLLSTGSTLTSARNIFMAQGCANVTALCLLSSL